MVFSSAHSLIGASLYFDINGPKQGKKLSVVVDINQDQVPVVTFYLKLREFMFKILCKKHIFCCNIITVYVYVSLQVIHLLRQMQE